MLRTKGHSDIAAGNAKWYPRRKRNLAIANKIINALTSRIAISLLENVLKIPWKKIQKTYTNNCQLDHYTLQQQMA